MITAFTGVPGGGKSLHAAQEILDAICKKGIPVIANFDVNRPKFEKVRFRRKKIGDFYFIPNNVLRPEDLIQFSKAHYMEHKFSENGILLVLDEAQLLFNARTWNDSRRADWVYFFTNSRHFGFRVILICQFLEMLDKQIRSVVEIEVQHRSMANFGAKGKILTLFVGGRLFACISYYVGLKTRIKVQYVFGRRHLFDFYDSYDTDAFQNNLARN